MYKISLDKKLILAFGSIILMICAVVIFAGFQLNRLSVLSIGIETKWLPGIVKTSELKENLNLIKMQQLEVVSTADPEQMKLAEDKLLEASGAFQIYLKTFEDLIDSDETQVLYDQTIERWDKISQLSDQMIDFAKKAQLKEGRELYVKESIPLFAESYNDLQELSNILYSGGIDATQSSSAEFKKTQLIMTILSILSVLLALGIAFSIYNNLTKLMYSVLSDLEGCSTQSSSYAQRLTDTSRELSNSAALSASSLTETASAVEQITSMIETTSNNADQSKDKSSESQQSVVAAQTAAKQLNADMGSLEHSMSSLDQQILKVMDSFNDIVNYMKSIDQKTILINDIVFQTKLLSFNASVEAARAGEFGKGFAVVAEEVGNLAQMSGRVSNEINTIVRESLDKVTNIVQNSQSQFEVLLNENRNLVQQGVITASEFDKIFESVVLNVHDVANKINEISTATSEQAKGIREISQALVQLEESTQKNATSADNVANSAQKINDQVDLLASISQKVQTVISGSKSVPQDSEKSISRLKSNLSLKNAS